MLGHSLETMDFEPAIRKIVGAVYIRLTFQKENVPVFSNAAHPERGNRL
jgi:hypothetical protein